MFNNNTVYKCADVNEICYTGGGKKIVSYGADGSMSFINVTNKDFVPCNNVEFRRDPLTGIPKQCYLKDMPYYTQLNGVPNKFTKCADEGGQCATSNSPADILYGANGTYLAGYLMPGQSVKCVPNTFGQDWFPVKGSCYLRENPKIHIQPTPPGPIAQPNIPMAPTPLPPRPIAQPNIPMAPTPLSPRPINPEPIPVYPQNYPQTYPQNYPQNYPQTVPSPTYPQTVPSPVNSGQNCQIPGGSWAESCTEGSINGSIMSARCKKNDGSPNTTTLDVRSCDPNSVWNDNGILRCNAGSGLCDNYYCTMPTGSWTDSCADPVINGKIFTANCKTPSGQTISSQLDISKCQPGSVWNNNGYLECGPGTGFCNAQGNFIYN